MPYPYSYPQPAQTMAHHLPGAQPPPRASPSGPRRESVGAPPPKPLGLPENRDFFAPPVSGNGKGKGNGRVTPQNDPHRRGMYIPGSPGEGSESGDETYGLEDDPWGDRKGRSGGGGIMGAVAGYVTGKQGRMTDEEIELEARRAKEESRREAERILASERNGRKVSQSPNEIDRQNMEDEVLRMLQSSGPPVTNPQAPAPTTPSTPKSGNPSWWTAARARLTPNKDRSLQPQLDETGKELTPAQQIALESRRLRKRSGSAGAAGAQKGTSWFSSRSEDKDKDKEGKAWPAKGDKADDPAFALLNGTAGRMSLDGPPTTGPPDHSRPRTQSLPPPRPSQASGGLSAPGTPLHAPPPLGNQRSPAPSFLSAAPRSPYLSHTPTGALNIPESVQSMAARLEKLERWTVAHVRALEDRMREVEEYIVGRESAWDGAEQGVRQLRHGLEEL
ncbi:hypothetical protein DACRYDRAFT_22610, partial [Dacryopinax primogenitus]